MVNEEATRAGAPQRLFAGLPRHLRRPRDEWNPPFCGELDMRIARDGTWHYLGSPIGRRELVRLFAGILRREADGRYYLVNPVEKVAIRVDDAPFLAVEVAIEGEGPGQSLAFRTNIDEVVVAGAEHPIRVVTDPASREPAPYLFVRDGLEALIARPVFYELVERAAERDGTLGVWSGGRFFALGRLDG